MNQSSNRRGFTLIELLAVMAIIAILAAALVPQIPKWIDQANVTACSANMADLHKNFVLYDQRFKDWPNEGGIRFFLRLWWTDPSSQDETFAKRFTCPGVQQRYLPGLRGKSPKEWFDDRNAVDSSYTAYAGRDIERFPNLESNAGNQAIVCDDNELADVQTDPRPNHRYATVVLYADGSVRPMDLIKLREDGIIGQNQYLIPGPDCPVEELRTVRRDAPEPARKGTKPGGMKSSGGGANPSNAAGPKIVGQGSSSTPPKKEEHK